MLDSERQISLITSSLSQTRPWVSSLHLQLLCCCADLPTTFDPKPALLFAIHKSWNKCTLRDKAKIEISRCVKLENFCGLWQLCVNRTLYGYRKVFNMRCLLRLAVLVWVFAEGALKSAKRYFLRFESGYSLCGNTIWNRFYRFPIYTNIFIYLTSLTMTASSFRFLLKIIFLF